MGNAQRELQTFLTDLFKTNAFSEQTAKPGIGFCKIGTRRWSRAVGKVVGYVVVMERLRSFGSIADAEAVAESLRKKLNAISDLGAKQSTCRGGPARQKACEQNRSATKRS